MCGVLNALGKAHQDIVGAGECRMNDEQVNFALSWECLQDRYPESVLCAEQILS
jgi:hypothetical protein